MKNRVVSNSGFLAFILLIFFYCTSLLDPFHQPFSIGWIRE
jgi:hypothetical protein